VVGAWQQAGGEAAELQRLGYRLYHEPRVDGDLDGILPNGGWPGQVVLVMSPERAGRWRAVLAGVECSAEAWHVPADASGTADESPGPGAPLDEVIRHVGLSTVGVYIDAQHLRGELGRLNVPPDL